MVPLIETLRREQWCMAWLLLGIYSSSPFAISFVIQNNRELTYYGMNASLGAKREHVVNLDDKHSNTFVLPVFPLRKVAKLPSEQLTLNLYEDRYLTMADYILSEDRHPPIFGALYSSDKPQFVRQGIGPVVPMVRKGDVGVIFVVEDWEMGLIPTVDGQARPRTRLIATGVTRFEITSVLENGFSSVEGALPFILVECGLVFDDVGTKDQEIPSDWRVKMKECLGSVDIGTESGEYNDVCPARYQELVSRLSSSLSGNRNKEEKKILRQALECEMLELGAVAEALPEKATMKRLRVLRSWKEA